jgi:tRNA(Ile2) C34 agmatinyltransferase TiaS
LVDRADAEGGQAIGRTLLVILNTMVKHKTHSNAAISTT